MDTCCDCGGAHPSSNTTLVSLDLSRPGEADIRRPGSKNPGKVASLANLFPEPELLRALLADRFIARALESSKKTTPPRTLG